MGRPRLYFTDEERRVAHNLATTKNKDKVRGGLPTTGPRATMCLAGHPWHESNSYFDKRGIRHCYICMKHKKRCRTVSLKLEVLSHYGPQGKMQCAWPECFVCDPDMLSIDHMNNDGAKDRKTINSGGYNFYSWLRIHEFPTGFQTLCHNHQWKKELMRRRGE